MRWWRVVGVCVLVVSSVAPLVGAEASGVPALRAGVAVVDATWHVGAAAGQYTPGRYGFDEDAVSEGEPPRVDEILTGDADPNLHATKETPSYGVQSRLTIRALVLEGSNGERVALVKSDNYLAQDLLVRRAAQLLAGGDSGIGYDQILYSASHNHSSPYYATPAWGVWLFQDVMDLRMFEWQARRIAAAIEQAAAGLRPARLGATTIEYSATQRNAPGPSLADDGTPAGYPDEDNDHGLVVLRVDDVTDAASPRPLATWVNYGQHPESLDSYELITADYLGPLERFVGRATGAPLLFSQGGVGSAEQPRRDNFAPGTEEPVRLPDGTIRAFSHAGHAQTERGARLMADAVLAGWREIGEGGGDVPFATDVPVGVVSWWVPGPVSHPYPSVSNCRSETTVEGNPGVPVLGLPDCEREGETDPTSMAWENLKAHGITPPEHYDFPGFTGVEENLRLRLQAVRLGEILLASCACEAQSDLIRNLESRADKDPATLWDGFDWGVLCDPTDDGNWVCADPRRRDDADRSLTVSDARYRRMQAQVHNDAAGWDDVANALASTGEPADPAEIKGNFTKEQLPPALGYDLVVGLGHTGDYNGYTVSYREYMNRDHYRKALTSYGPHTADYMVTRLVRLGGWLKGGPQPTREPLDVLAQADEARQQALAIALGQAAAAAYDGWEATLPDDAGAPEALGQPASITRFDASTFVWRGGSNWVDNPVVHVERLVEGGWKTFADQTGEVQTMVDLPNGLVQSLVASRTGSLEWVWTANFEAFDGFPSSIGSTPSGTYRFVVEGHHRAAGRTNGYRLVSDSFEVAPWDGITAHDLRAEPDGSVSFVVDPIAYPRTYESPFPFVHDDGNRDDDGNPIAVCRTCSFRPWAETGRVATARVTVHRANGAVDHVPATFADGRWVAAAALAPGDAASVERGDVVDENGEINGAAVGPVGAATSPSANAATATAQSSTVRSAGVATDGSGTSAATRPVLAASVAGSMIGLVLVAAAAVSRRRRPKGRVA
jgi:hypothetical protein